MSDKGTEIGVSYHPSLVLSQTVGIFLPTPVTRCYDLYVKTTIRVSSFEVLLEL